jgi:hypothetical protein
MSKKIAPMLSWWIEQFTEPPVKPGTQDKARAELRALLAVARVAMRVAPFVRMDCPDMKRALARLDRASGRKP